MQLRSQALAEVESARMCRIGGEKNAALKTHGDCPPWHVGLQPVVPSWSQTDNVGLTK